MKLISGDCIEAMRELPDESVDAIVTDPPYGLGFMGKQWDELPPGKEWAEECLRVLKPGGHLLAFGGSRTYHRLAAAVEDAGFEIRDQIMWIYGSGFPKSLDVSKAIDKQRYDREEIEKVVRWLESTRKASGVSRADVEKAFGTINIGQAFFTITPGSQPRVPTLEQVPVLLDLFGVDPDDVPEDIARLIYELNGRKGQPGENWFKREIVGIRSVPVGHAFAGPTYGGDSSSQDVNETAPATDQATQWEGWGTALKPAHEPIVVARKPLAGTVAENVLRFGTGALNIDGCRIGIDPEDRWAQGVTFRNSSQFAPGSPPTRGDVEAVAHNAGRWPANVVLGEEAGRLLDEQSGESKDGVAVRRNGGGNQFGISALGVEKREPAEDQGYGGSGGASRFFYCAKASKGERNAGLDALPDKVRRRVNSGGLENDPRWAPVIAKNNHPTVKPISLMRYLVRLVTPPEGTVLDPFLGSGTTGCAAVLEGFNFIGIEREAEYLAIAQARIAWWEKHRGDGATEEILKAAGVRDEIEAGGQLGLLGEAA